jgi:hypothetical protein
MSPDDIPDPLPDSIVRPRQQLLAVRAQSLLETGAHGRTALAWDWALTGNRPSPVTLALAPGLPPAREQILAEATAPPDSSTAPPGVPTDSCDQFAETRRVLAWLAGASDEIPVDSENRGKLIGARDDYARTDTDIRQVRDHATRRLQSSGTRMADDLADPGTRRRQEASTIDDIWLRSIRDLLDWVLGDRPDSPLCHRVVGLPAAYDLTYEEGAAEEMASRGNGAVVHSETACSHPRHGGAIATTIRWLRGESTTSPIDQEDSRA